MAEEVEVEDKKEEKENEEDNKIIVVTGANKGIGLATVELLVKYGNFHVILACRGFGTLENKLTRIEILKNKFKNITNIDFVEIDLCNQQTINNAVKYVKEKYKNIDILINNAGIMLHHDNEMNKFNFESVKKHFDVNYYGTINVTESFMSIINKNGKIFNICSRGGSLGKCYSVGNIIQDKEMRNILLSHKLTQIDIDNIIQQFFNAIKKDVTLKNTPFKQGAYGTSKAMEIAWSRVLSIKLKDKNKNIWVGHYCPGYVATSMNNGKGNRNTKQGAKGIELVIINNNLPTGLFWGIEYDDHASIDSGYLVNYDWINGKATKFNVSL